MKLIASIILAAGLAFAQIPATITTTTTVDDVVAAINNGLDWLDKNKMGIPSDYSAGTTYQKGDCVISSGLTYVSLQNSNTGNTPASSGAYWRNYGGGTTSGSGGLVRDFMAAACQSAAASLALSAASASQPVPDCVISTNGVIFGVARFANDKTYALQGHFGLPASFTSAAVDFRWRTSIANTGLSAKWNLEAVCLADNESDDPAFGTAQSVTTAAKSAANRLIVSTISSVTLPSCAATEQLFWRVFRDPTADTLGATAELISVKWTVQ